MLSIAGVAAERSGAAPIRDGDRRSGAVGAATIAAERRRIWTRFLCRYSEAMEIPKMPSLNVGK